MNIMDRSTTIAEFCLDFPRERRKQAMLWLEAAAANGNICHAGTEGSYWIVDMRMVVSTRSKEHGRLPRGTEGLAKVSIYLALRVCPPSRRRAALSRYGKDKTKQKTAWMTLDEWRAVFDGITSTVTLEMQPTSMSNGDFLAALPDLRKRVGVLGLIEMQGLTGAVLDEDIELERKENPSLDQAIKIARVFRERRLLNVSAYDFRLSEGLEEEIAQVQSVPSMGSTSSPTAVYAKLEALGLRTSLHLVRKAMGLQETEAYVAPAFGQ